MKIKDITDVKTKEEARQIAIDWQLWQSNQSLSYWEVSQWHEYFYNLAIRFDLYEEFKENCII